MPLTIERNDLARMDVDAIVVAANERLQITGGVGAAVAAVAGFDDMQAACDAIGFCPTGSAVATPGFRLSAKVVVHAVGPIWLDGRSGEADLLYGAYEAALRCAAKAGATSIALPLISAGSYRFPPELSLMIARDAIRAFLDRYDAEVRLVLYDRSALVAGLRAYGEVASYIDDVYVQNNPPMGTTVLSTPERRSRWESAEDVRLASAMPPSNYGTSLGSQRDEPRVSPGKPSIIGRVRDALFSEKRKGKGGREIAGDELRSRGATRLEEAALEEPAGVVGRQAGPAGQEPGASQFDSGYVDEAVDESASTAGFRLGEAAASFASEADFGDAAAVQAPEAYFTLERASSIEAPTSWSEDAAAASPMDAASPAPTQAAPSTLFEEGTRMGRAQLADLLDSLDEPFSTTLLALIDARGLSDSEVYKRANMSRQLFSKIRSDATYRPSKKTVLALAVALRLDLGETVDLLQRAGFALSHSSKADVIVEFFLASGNHDIFEINEMLYAFDQPLL